jgi:membrane associated rhomboid family serine protease
VLFQICFSIPFFAVFVWLDVVDGRLTPFRVVYVAAIASIGGAVSAVLFWYTVSSSLIARRRKRESESH